MEQQIEYSCTGTAKDTLMEYINRIQNILLPMPLYNPKDICLPNKVTYKSEQVEFEKIYKKTIEYIFEEFSIHQDNPLNTFSDTIFIPWCIITKEYKNYIFIDKTNCDICNYGNKNGKCISDKTSLYNKLIKHYNVIEIGKIKKIQTNLFYIMEPIVNYMFDYNLGILKWGNKDAIKLITPYLLHLNELTGGLILLNAIVPIEHLWPYDKKTTKYALKMIRIELKKGDTGLKSIMPWRYVGYSKAQINGVEDKQENQYGEISCDSCMYAKIMGTYIGGNHITTFHNLYNTHIAQQIKNEGLYPALINTINKSLGDNYYE